MANRNQDYADLCRLVRTYGIAAMLHAMAERCADNVDAMLIESEAHPNQHRIRAWNRLRAICAAAHNRAIVVQKDYQLPKPLAQLEVEL